MTKDKRTAYYERYQARCAEEALSAEGMMDRIDFWISKGLGTRAANALGMDGCASEADVRALGVRGLIKIPNVSWKTVREIGRVLFKEDWSRPRQVSLPDQTLITELEARGYTVCNPVEKGLQTGAPND